MNKVTVHKNGRITYWSVYNQCWVNSTYVPPLELAAMSSAQRARVQKAMIRNGCEPRRGATVMAW